MSSPRKASPSLSEGRMLTPRRETSRRPHSVGSPALSNASGRLSSMVQEYRERNLGSFALSPMVRRSMLTDNTDIEEPRRKSWWKKLDENSRDINEVMEVNEVFEPNNIIEELDIEVLSQEKKNYTLDLPESSDGESINSIVIPQRKLFIEKENVHQKKFGHFGTRDTLSKLHKSNAITDVKIVNTKAKQLFPNKPRSKPIFPAALLNMSPNKTTGDKTLIGSEPKGQVRNIFGNRQGTKRKNMFANFIVSESEDEIPEIQPKVFEFQKKTEVSRCPSSSSRYARDASPASNITTDMELDHWRLLPSSTMVETQLEALIADTQTPKKARLSKLSEVKESRAETNSTVTGNETKKSNKSTSKNKSKTMVKEKSPEPNTSVLTRNRSKVSHDEDVQLNKQNETVREGAQNKCHELHNQSYELAKDDDGINNKTQEQSQDTEHKSYQEIGNDESNEDEQEEEISEAENADMDESQVLQYESDEEQALNQEMQNESQEIQNESQEEYNEIQEDHNESQKIQNESKEKENESHGEYNEIQEDHNKSQEIQNESKEEKNESQGEYSEICEDHNKIQEIQNESIKIQNISQEIQNESQEDENESQEDHNKSQEKQNESQEEQIESQEIQNEIEEEEEIGSEPEDEDQENNESQEISENVQQSSSQEEIEQNESMEVDQDIESEAAHDSADEQSTETDQEDEEIQHDQEAETNENQEECSEEIDTDTPLVSHDTTGRTRKNDESPEMILHDSTQHAASFAVHGRNTSVRKTKSIVKNLNIRQSLDPVRESIGFSDGTKNSSAEGSGWDSHRTTRKTLRQTFGRDFTPRKSLRAWVMEKSAKRQTMTDDTTSVTVKLPLANSTELPEESLDRDDYVETNEPQESDHEVSKRTRQTMLEMYLQKIKKQNVENRAKIEESVRNSLKAPPRDAPNPFKVPTRSMFPRRPISKASKPKTKPIRSFISLGDLPEDVIQDMKYKPPKRFQPSNAPWITKRLYKYLETKLEPKYDYKARVRSEKLVETLYHFVKEVRRHDTVASSDAVHVLKHEMARLDIVKTHFEFYDFIHEFMPREVRIKVIPDVVNKIPVPRNGVFADII